MLAALFLWCPANAQTVNLAWDPVASATGYRVYCSTNNFTSPILAVSQTAVTVGVNINVQTRFYVTATNSVGEGPPSNLVTNQPSATGTLALTAPVLSGVTSNYFPSSTITATATVVNKTGAPFQVIQAVLTAREPGASNVAGPFDDFAPEMIPQTLAVGQGFSLTASWQIRANAPIGTWRVYFTVKGNDGWHDGPSTSFNVIAVPPPSPPPAPTNLRVTQVAPRRRDFSWLSDVDASSVVELAIESDPFKQVAVLSPGNMHWTDSKARSKPTRYRVKSCKVLCSAWSEITWRP